MSASDPCLVSGVILAAGTGSRMGDYPKQLLMLDGKVLVQHVLDSALESDLAELVVVLGHEYLHVRELIWEGRHGQVIVNPHYQKGQSSSVKAGIRSVSPSMHAAMVLLGDQPGVTSMIIDTMIEAYALSRPPLVVPRYQGKRGNPVIIDRRLFADINELAGDTGARALFDHRTTEIEYVDFDFPAPPDIDTMDDYKNVVGAFPD